MPDSDQWEGVIRNMDRRVRERKLGEALLLLEPHERLIIYLSYLSEQSIGLEIPEVLQLSELNLQFRVVAEIIRKEAGAFSGQIRLCFYRDGESLSRPEISKMLGFSEMNISSTMLRQDLTQTDLDHVRQGRIYLIYFRCDLTSAEIGQILGFSQEKVRVVRHRAVSKLRAYLDH